MVSPPSIIKSMNIKYIYDSTYPAMKYDSYEIMWIDKSVTELRVRSDSKSRNRSNFNLVGTTWDETKLYMYSL